MAESCLACACTALTPSPATTQHAKDSECKAGRRRPLLTQAPTLKSHRFCSGPSCSSGLVPSLVTLGARVAFLSLALYSSANSTIVPTR